MKALVKTRKGDGHLTIQDVPEPVAAPGWVVLDVFAAGICGTDLHIWHDEHPYWPPVVLGHEFTGRVHEVGDGVTGWRPGDRAVCEPHQGACGVCHLCRRGEAHLCVAKRSPGWGIDGADAPYVAVPAHLLHHVPEEVSDLAAALCEPTAIAVTALQRIGVEVGDRVVVFGPGPVGLLCAMVARAMGAGDVAVVGRNEASPRFRLAQDLGFVAWPATADVLDRARTVSDGRGVDLVVDASGGAAAIATGVRILRRRGRFVAVGVSGRPTLEFPYDDALFRALDVAFSYSSAYASWEGALRLMRRGTVTPEPLATVFPLSRWEDAFAAAQSSRVVKALLDPHA